MGKYTLVEECLALDARVLSKTKVLRPNVVLSGTWGWPTGQSVHFAVDTLEEGYSSMRLVYEAREESMDYTVKLHRRDIFNGGWFYLFTCPIVHHTRKARKIYLPPSGSVFACFACHNLMYQCTVEQVKPYANCAQWYPVKLAIQRATRQRAVGYPVVL